MSRTAGLVVVFALVSCSSGTLISADRARPQDGAGDGWRGDAWVGDRRVADAPARDSRPADLAAWDSGRADGPHDAGPSGDAGGKTNPLTGPTHWPSVISYASLNQVAVPATESDWMFEINHLDAAHGVDHVAGILSRNPDFYYIKYELLETQITTDPDVNALVNYCKSIGADPENAFYHYYDDTTLDLSHPDGSSAVCTDGAPGTTIKGWGGGTAATRAEARVKSCPGGGNVRYTWNHGDTTCLQPYMKHRTRQDVTAPVTGTAHFRGAFWDEFTTVSGCSGSVCLWAFKTASAGGHIAELGQKTKAQAIGDGSYETNLKVLLNVIQTDVAAYTSNDALTFPNTANCSDASCKSLGIASGGLLTEFWDTEVPGAGAGTQPLWNFADAVLANKKVFIWVEGDHTTPADPTFTACDYASKDSRHRMWSLANYWQIKDGGHYAWYSQRPHYIPLSTFWYAAQEHSLGTPSGPRKVVQSGTTGGGYTYAIVRRDYSDAIVLTVTRNGYGTDVTRDFSERVGTPIALGGTYHVLNADGTMGPPVTSIQPCYLEAVVLVP